jgi:hypothetical protein
MTNNLLEFTRLIQLKENISENTDYVIFEILNLKI